MEQSTAMQTTDTNTSTQTVITASENIGLELANELANSESEVFTARKVMLKNAFAKVQGEANIKQFLNGFAEGLTAQGASPAVRDSRKSEVKALITFYKQATAQDVDAIEEACKGYHELVKAARGYHLTLQSPEEKAEAEAKKATQKANREAKAKLEAEAKAKAEADIKAKAEAKAKAQKELAEAKARAKQLEKELETA